jgi:hypothetical protein
MREETLESYRELTALYEGLDFGLKYSLYNMVTEDFSPEVMRSEPDALFYGMGDRSDHRRLVAFGAAAHDALVEPCDRSLSRMRLRFHMLDKDTRQRIFGKWYRIGIVAGRENGVEESGPALLAQTQTCRNFVRLLDRCLAVDKEEGREMKGLRLGL